MQRCLEMPLCTSLRSRPAPFCYIGGHRKTGLKSCTLGYAILFISPQQSTRNKMTSGDRHRATEYDPHILRDCGAARQVTFVWNSHDAAPKGDRPAEQDWESPDYCGCGWRGGAIFCSQREMSSLVAIFIFFCYRVAFNSGCLFTIM
jgi:hypothetical protein